MVNDDKMALDMNINSEGHPAYLCDQDNNTNMGLVYSPEKKKELLKYIEPKLGLISQREIARRIGIGNTTVNNWSLELGFKHIKHTVNEEFFDDWNEYSAYILGYIFADGNIAWNPKKGYYCLTITASEKDKIHLIRIRKILNSTKPLTYGSSTKSYRLIANSKILCKKLMKMGVIPKKSLIVKFPEIPKEHLRHFMRGVIDGDGSVRYVDRKRSPYFEIQVSSGSPKFLKRMMELIERDIEVKTKMRNIHGNTYLIRYTCTRGKILADWIYKDAHMYLPRKYNEYKILLEEKGGENR